MAETDTATELSDLSSTIAAALTRAATIVNQAREELRSLDAKKIAMGAEVLAITQQLEPLRQDAAGQGQAAQAAFAKAREAAVAQEKAEKDLAGTMAKIEKDMAAARKKADAAYAERVEEKQKELADLDAKFEQAKAKYDAWKASLA